MRKCFRREGIFHSFLEQADFQIAKLLTLEFGEGVENESRRKEELLDVGTVDNDSDGKVCPAIRYLEEVVQTAGQMGWYYEDYLIGV